jgi:predicted ATPase
MLSELILENFKLFKEHTVIPLSTINLLTGVNGRGKSTVLQAFLLFKQSVEIDRTTNKVFFNGPYINLGTYTDVKNVAIGLDLPIKIAFIYKRDNFNYSADYNINYLPEDALAGFINLNVAAKSKNQEYQFFLPSHSDNNRNSNADNAPTFVDLFFTEPLKNKVLRKIRETLPFLCTHYISADRIGPQLFYPDKSPNTFFSVGQLGEETVNVLHHSRDQHLAAIFLEKTGKLFNIPDDAIPQTVEQQTNLWLDKIFRAAKYEIKQISDANLLTFSFSTDGKFNYFKPTNVGYGYSYALPIIVAGLIAKPGEFLLVENPEAHLHPFAQSMIAKFLALVSQKGVQIIIESHSEHILNGLRLPIFDGLVNNEDLNVLYFTDNSTGKYFRKIEIDARGGIQEWPNDFFDQATKDINRLFGI